MNITSPTLTGIGRAAELPADALTSCLRAIGLGDSPDGGLGIIMSALALSLIHISEPTRPY